MKRHINKRALVLKLASGQIVKGVEAGYQRDGYEAVDGWKRYQFRDGESDFYGSIAESVWVDYVGDFLTQDTINFPEGTTELDVASYYYEN